MIEYFNFYYFLFLAIVVGLVIGLYFLLRNKKEKTVSIVLFCILLGNFALHFLKLTAEHYQSWMPTAIRTITPENICAFSVLVFPWFYISGKKLLRDYMFYMGVMSGVAATLLPIDVIGFEVLDFETIRFYTAHIILWVVPLLMVVLGVHTLDYKRIPKVPLIALFTLCIILVNEVILVGAGFVQMEHFFSYEIRNPALIFGPLPAVEPAGTILTALTPAIFTTVPIGPNAGETFYWPIVWMIIPGVIYFSAMSFLLCLPFEFKKIKGDFVGLFRV